MVKPTDVEIEVKGVSPQAYQEGPYYEVEFKIRVRGQHEFGVVIITETDSGLFDQALHDALGSLLGIGRGITEQAGNIKAELISRSPGIQRTYNP